MDSQNQTIYGGGKLPLDCAAVNGGLLGKGTRCNASTSPIVLQMTGYVVPATKVDAPMFLIPKPHFCLWQSLGALSSCITTSNIEIENPRNLNAKEGQYTIMLLQAQYLFWILLAVEICASPLPQSKRQNVPYDPAIIVGSVGPDVNIPLSWINSTRLPVALTKTLQLNITQELSRFNHNGSYKDLWELPDINNKNFKDPNRCYWPQLGQRYQLQVYKTFVSKTSSSTLSFWINDESNGRYVHCVNDAPRGFNLLRTYVMIDCLENIVAWELRGEQADSLLIQSVYECKGFFALAEAEVKLDTVCAPILDGTQCQTPIYPYFPITSIVFAKSYTGPYTPLPPSGFRSMGSPLAELRGTAKRRKRR
ncbi:MAG: hypothetical protein Q9174_001572 [Haloplaca sp. 1 TL-2023]